MSVLARMNRRNKAWWRRHVKRTKQDLLFTLAIAVATMVVVNPLLLRAQTTAAKSPDGAKSTSEQWSVQVTKIDPGDVQIAPSFQIAIYEDLLTELRKTKRFEHVIRDGNRNAGDASDLLILKTTVRKYSAGSETRRAVTTISGATKLTIQSQLCRRDGTVVLE